jgi:hypothetical protein
MALSEQNHTVVEQQRGFGRIPAFDPRDQQHRMAAEAPIVVTVDRRLWPVPVSIPSIEGVPNEFTTLPLDQGPTSQCTEFGGQYLLLAGPVQQPYYMKRGMLYRANQLNDEWPGTETDEPRYEGSSVHALMKVLKAAGLIDRYVWAFEAETVRRWVLMKSPVVVGTDWLEGMNKTTPAGFARVKGRVLGGHCYILIGADERVKCPDGTKGAFIILNSWGKNWGYKDSGYAFISYRDMDRLIKRAGEAATAVEFLNATPIPITGVINESS